MRLLFDSHALVWYLAGAPRFSGRARTAVERDDAIAYISAVTAWEVANKVRLGKWPEANEFAQTFTDTLARFDFELLSVTVEHALVAGFLPGSHRDPFDRMLAAQARVENIPLISVDPAFKAMGVQVLW